MPQSSQRLRSNQNRTSYQLPKVLKLEKASQSYCLHAKANLEPASTTPQQNTPRGK